MKSFTLLLLLIPGFGLYAQNPGDLFTDYGSDGLITEDWPDTITYSFDITVLPDGHILVPAAYKEGTLGTGRILCSLLDNTGEICEFGNSGKGFEFDFAAEEMSSASYILPDGKIIISGCYGNAMNYFPFVLRLLPNGTLDTEFGTDGIFRDESIQIQVLDMQVYHQADSYSIILAGSDALHKMKMIMVNDDGELETSFGSSGIIDITGYDGMLQNIVLDNSGGNVFGCGYLETGSVLFKYNLPEGTPDASFGTDGIISYTPGDGFNGRTRAIVFNPENNTLTAFGYYLHTAGDEDIFAWRIDATDGSPDATFGVGGWAALRSAGSDDKITCAILQSDGKYYFAGESDFFGTSDLLIGRINSNGGPDTEFGTNGLVMYVAPEDQMIFNIALNPAQTMLYTIGIQNEAMGSAVISGAFYTGYELAVSTNNRPDIKMNLFPNPTRGIIRFTSEIAGPHEVSVFDITGTKLLQKEFSGNRFDLDLQTLPSSIYIIKVLSPGMEERTYKIVRE